MVPCPAVSSPGFRPTVVGLSRVKAAAAGALLALVGLLVGQGRVSYAQTSDPFGTLLVSQALARHGTIHLEVLGVPDLEARLAYRGFERNGHTYYVYPLGTALVATPFVALADALGFELAHHEAEVRLQHWLATLAAVVLVALLLASLTVSSPWPFPLLTLALMAAGEVGNPAVERGMRYLMDTQTEKGLWDEARYTATGFPRVFYLRYHGYAKFFPLWALARFRNLKSTNSKTVRVGM